MIFAPLSFLFFFLLLFFFTFNGIKFKKKTKTIFFKLTCKSYEKKKFNIFSIFLFLPVIILAFEAVIAKDTWKYFAINAMNPVDIDCSATNARLIKSHVGFLRSFNTFFGISMVRKEKI